MPGNRDCTVYVGNLDDRVTDRVLYDILIQVGRIVDLHIPRDKETNRHKGYAFVEYETEEIANYAVRLFSGLVIMYNRTLKFAISGQDKPSQNPSMTVAPASNTSFRPRPYPVQYNSIESSQHMVSNSCRFMPSPLNYSQEPAPPGVEQPSHYIKDVSKSFEYSRRVLGASLDSISRSSSGRYGSRNPIPYPSY